MRANICFRGLNLSASTCEIEAMATSQQDDNLVEDTSICCYAHLQQVSNHGSVPITHPSVISSLSSQPSAIEHDSTFSLM